MKPFEDHLFIKSHRKYWLKKRNNHKTKNKREIHKLCQGMYPAFEFCMVYGVALLKERVLCSFTTKAYVKEK